MANKEQGKGLLFFFDYPILLFAKSFRYSKKSFEIFSIPPHHYTRQIIKRKQVFQRNLILSQKPNTVVYYGLNLPLSKTTGEYIFGTFVNTVF
jgi:hypothetical protein